jgi:flagellin
MSNSIKTNVSSLNAQRRLAETQLRLEKGMRRMSSGLRVNSGADDAAGLAISLVDLRTQLGLTSAMGMLDTAIHDVSSARAKVGAFQNRLHTSVNNLASAKQNLTAADSRLRDADVAVESAEMAKNHLLMRAGSAVLLQANQSSELALALMG